MKKHTIMSNEDLTWLYDAVGYGNVSSIGAAYNKLLQFRSVISNGSKIEITSQQRTLATTDEYDEWVRNTFPVFEDDQLHPAFVKTK